MKKKLPSRIKIVLYIFTTALAATGCFNPRLKSNSTLSSSVSLTSSIAPPWAKPTWQLGTSYFWGGNSDGQDWTSHSYRDGNGNIYIAGFTSGSLADVFSGGMSDIHVSKWTPKGELAWIRQLGTSIGAASSMDDRAYSVTADTATGDVYITGSSNGAFGETGAGSNDVILAKWDTNGTLQWRRQLGNVTLPGIPTLADIGYAVAVGSNSMVYVAGVTWSNLTEATGGAGDLFLACWSTAGVFQWVRHMGSVTVSPSPTGGETVGGIAINSANEIFVTGRTNGNFGEVNGGGTGDVYLIKFNSAGAIQWRRQLGNVTLPGASGNGDFGRDIALDSLGNIYVTGDTQGNFGETNGGGTDIFYAKFNSSGTLQYIRQLGNISRPGTSAGTENASKIAVSNTSEVYVSFTTNGSIGETNGGNTDIVVAKWSSSGDLQFVKQWGASYGLAATQYGEYTTGCHVDNDGYIYISGQTWSNLGDTNAFGSEDVFLLQWHP